jgi:hypothetical protein
MFADLSCALGSSECEELTRTVTQTLFEDDLIGDKDRSDIHPPQDRRNLHEYSRIESLEKQVFSPTGLAVIELQLLEQDGNNSNGSLLLPGQWVSLYSFPEHKDASKPRVVYINNPAKNASNAAPASHLQNIPLYKFKGKEMVIEPDEAEEEFVVEADDSQKKE